MTHETILHNAGTHSISSHLCIIPLRLHTPFHHLLAHLMLQGCITNRETGEPGKGARFEMTVPKGTWRMAGKGA